MSRMKPDERKQSILNAAIKLAEKTSYLTLTLTEVAEHAEVSFPLVHHYFKSIDELKQSVMLTAVISYNYKIIAQGLAHSDSVALTASPATQKKASLMIQKG